MISFFSEKDIIIAKKLIWEIGCDKLDTYVERRTTDRRSCSEASVDDMAEAILKLDALSLLPGFLTMNMENLPDIKPEELNFTYLLNRLNSVENKVKI